MAVASLVLGIVSLVVVFLGGISGWVGSACGILAIIFGAVSRKNPEKKNMATAGMVMGIIACCLGIIVTIACVACVNMIGFTGVITVPEFFDSIDSIIDSIDSDFIFDI